MTDYRCYLLGQDGYIKGSQVIECPTDAAALEEAQRRLATAECAAIEVWDRARRVGHVGRAMDHPEMSAQKPGSGTASFRAQS
jgi:hypothetical protein